MRITTALLTAAILGLTGCSTKTALDAFNMDSQTERTVTHLRTATFVHEGKTDTVISTVYLNPVFPERYSGDEYFFVALYRAQEQPFVLTLNGGVLPDKVEELDPDDTITRLMPIQNRWNRYYLVRYPRQEGETLTLKLENGPSATGALDYQKDAL